MSHRMGNFIFKALTGNKLSSQSRHEETATGHAEPRVRIDWNAKEMNTLFRITLCHPPASPFPLPQSY